MDSYGLKFRSTLAAEPGNLLLKADFRSFHALTLGDEAEDEAYVRVARLDGGVHSYLASYMVNQPASLSWNDKKLGEHLSWIKKEYKSIRDGQAKRGILGWQFGMEEYLLWKENPEVFKNRKESGKVIELINHCFPKAAAFREGQVWEAHTVGFLDSKYKYRRWFWEAKMRCPKCSHGWRKVSGKTVNTMTCPRCRKVRWVNGSQAKEAMAFRGANNAHGHMRDTDFLLAGLGQKIEWKKFVWQDGQVHLESPSNLLEIGRHINIVHDENVFEPRKKDLARLAKAVKEIMERPNPILKSKLHPKGLWIGVDLKVGRNWRDMEDLKI